MKRQFVEQSFTLYLYRSERKLNGVPMHVDGLITTLEVHDNDTHKSLLPYESQQRTCENKLFGTLQERYETNPPPATVSYDVPPQLPSEERIEEDGNVFEIERKPLDDPQLEARIEREFEMWKDPSLRPPVIIIRAK